MLSEKILDALKKRYQGQIAEGFAKMEVGLGKGKKTYDKRETLKKRDSDIEINRKKREK